MRKKKLQLIRAVLRQVPLPISLKQKVKDILLSNRLGAWLWSPLGRVRIETIEPVDKEKVRANAEQELTDFLAGDLTIELPPTNGNPTVSVAIVLYNQAGLSLKCLQSLADSTCQNYETIIIDNASTDRTQQLLARVRHARSLSQPTNEGFLLAVNAAATMATGRYLLLLNNDALLMPDSLQAAIDRLDADSTVGAVGGSIQLWDGTLQEAGSIIWNDGSCLGYGRGRDPVESAFSFVRDVDYCSGAFLMVRRDLFEALGRLDVDYCPAYYEETDLCVRIWKAGYRVVYDPKVSLRHFEFASTGTSNQWALELQRDHQKLFQRKHAEFLAKQYAPSTSNIALAAARRAPGTRRILMIDDRVPHPSLGEGYPRAVSIVHTLTELGHWITFLPLQFPTRELNPDTREIPQTVEIAWDVDAYRLRDFLSSRSDQYDTWFVSRPHNAMALNHILDKDPQLLRDVKFIYDAEALFSLREARKAQVLRTGHINQDEQTRQLNHELGLARYATQITTVSHAERQHFLGAGYSQVEILGHTLHSRPTETAFEERAGFLFVGTVQADDSPNGDSLIWFLQKVWPSIKAQLPEARLDIVGQCVSPALHNTVHDGVTFRGRVPDVQPYYASSRVFIVPTRFAAGIPHKAHEAAAAGLPIVCTHLIAQQLGWEHFVPHTDDPIQFAKHCVELHQDRHLWFALSDKVSTHVATDCDPNTFKTKLKSILN